MYDRRDWNSHEQSALFAASEAQGASLEGAGQTDVALLTSDQWKAMIAAGIHAYCAKLAELEKDQVPF